MELGHFASEEDAIADGLRARLDEAAYWTELAEMLEEGRESLRAGRGTPWTPDLAERVLREAGDLSRLQMG